MSRVGKNPVILPAGVTVKFDKEELFLQGPLGSSKIQLHSLVLLKKEGEALLFEPVDTSREANALTGTFRALIANMVHGITKGFEKKLLLVGVGYRAQSMGNELKLQLGFSHDVIYSLPEGIKAETPTQTEIIIKGLDKQKVGQIASEIRAYRPPEPYKGKGVRYSDETVSLKETKKK